MEVWRISLPSSRFRGPRDPSRSDKGTSRRALDLSRSTGSSESGDGRCLPTLGLDSWGRALLLVNPDSRDLPEASGLPTGPLKPGVETETPVGFPPVVRDGGS